MVRSPSTSEAKPTNNNEVESEVDYMGGYTEFRRQGRKGWARIREERSDRSPCVLRLKQYFPEDAISFCLRLFDDEEIPTEASFGAVCTKTHDESKIVRVCMLPIQ